MISIASIRMPSGSDLKYAPLVPEMASCKSERDTPGSRADRPEVAVLMKTAPLIDKPKAIPPI